MGSRCAKILSILSNDWFVEQLSSRNNFTFGLITGHQHFIWAWSHPYSQWFLISYSTYGTGHSIQSILNTIRSTMRLRLTLDMPMTMNLYLCLQGTYYGKWSHLFWLVVICTLYVYFVQQSISSHCSIPQDLGFNKFSAIAIYSRDC